MRGRKPRSPERKALDGERPDRTNPTPPRAGLGVGDPPEVLDDEGKAQWRRLAPLLESAGVLKETDSDALALYCEHYSTWVKATNSLRAIGLVTTCGTGGLKPNPAAGIAREAMAAMRALLVEFGCTPSARSRVKADAEAEDELGEFL